MFTTPPLHNYHSKPAKSSPRLPILLFNIYLLFIYPYGVMKTGMCGLVASDASFIFACYCGLVASDASFIFACYCGLVASDASFIFACYCGLVASDASFIFACYCGLVASDASFIFACYCGLVASDASFIFACYWGINVAELRFNWLGNPKSLIGHKMVPVPLCSPHISHRMGRDWTRDPPRQESDNYRPEVWRVSLSHCSRPMQICLRSHCSCVQPLCLKYLQK